MDLILPGLFVALGYLVAVWYLGYVLDQRIDEARQAEIDRLIKAAARVIPFVGYTASVEKLHDELCDAIYIVSGREWNEINTEE
jgi:hypothetical protein